MSVYTSTNVGKVVDELREQVRQAFGGEQGSLLFELLRIPQDKKIARIKEVRSATGLNLKDAKTVVDRVNEEIPFAEAYFKTDRIDSLQRQLDDTRDDILYAQRQRDAALEELSDLKQDHLHLKARLGARDREVRGYDREQTRMCELINAAQRVTETLVILQKDDAVVKGLTDALTAILDQTLAQPLDADDVDDVPF